MFEYLQTYAVEQDWSAVITNPFYELELLWLFSKHQVGHRDPKMPGKSKLKQELL